MNKLFEAVDNININKVINEDEISTPTPIDSNNGFKKGDRYKNRMGTEVEIIDVDDIHKLDGEPQVTMKFASGDAVCQKESTIRSILSSNSYEKINESKLEENFGDTTDYSSKIEKVIRQYWKRLEDKKLFDAIADIEIEVERTKDQFRKPLAYYVDIATMRKGLNDRADEIGRYVAGAIPSIEYAGYKDTKMFDTDFGSDTTLKFTQDQSFKDFGADFESEDLTEGDTVILDDNLESQINELIHRIEELQNTIKHTVSDEIISINARIEELNETLYHRVDEIDTEDKLYFNTTDVISDLKYAIKESDWAKEDKETDSE